MASGGEGAVAPRDVARRAVYELKTHVARHPALAIPIARLRHGIPFGPRTQLVIEGFPRTGTSFAVAAFQMAQPGAVEVACHVHAPAQVMAAVRARVPALVIVREPEDTVLSFVIRNPHISPAQALRGYLRFYEPLLPYRDGFVVALFSEVTKDFGAVTAKVNDTFRTAFAEFDHTEESVRACFEAIDSDYERRLPSGPALERAVARPSEYRRDLKARMSDEYRRPGTSRLRARAERVFRVFESLADAGRA